MIEKLIDLDGCGLTVKWYSIWCRDGGKEIRKLRDEVFGCIPHGAGACVLLESLV